jgi:ATP-dependent helicase STH1/SNF2
LALFDHPIKFAISSMSNKPLSREEYGKLFAVMEEMKESGKTLRNKDYKSLCLYLKNEAKKFSDKKNSDDRQFRITAEQTAQIHAQTFALLHFNSMLPIPPSLLNAVRGYNPISNLMEYQVTVLPQVENQFKKLSTPKPTFPYDIKILKDSASNFSQMEKERETIISDRVKRKLQDLKDQMTMRKSLPSDFFRPSIDYRLLSISGVQKSVRNDVYGEGHAYFKIPHYDQVGEKERRTLEGKRRRTEISKELQALDHRKQFLGDLAHHTQSMVHQIHKFKKLKEKLGRELIHYFEKRAKLMAERKDQADKARIRALKENDKEGYMKLLEGAKETRILDLIKKTDDVLISLGAQIVKGRDAQDTLKLSTKTSALERYQENESNYYSITHKIQEKVDKQPTWLQGNLKAYQVSGLEWMVSLYNNNLNGILADELGLGKTIETIALLTYLAEHKGNHGPHLVIAPLSTLDNWANEFAKWSPRLVVLRYGGTPDQRKIIQNQLLKGKFDVVLTQYEYVCRDKAMLKRVRYQHIIVDEGHRLKNKDAKLVNDLKTYPSKHRLLLTGTPLQNDLGELWALLNFLLPHVFDNVENFDSWFNAPFLGEKITMNEEEHLLIIQRLHQILRPFLLRREKKDVESQLPEKVEKVIRVPLSGMQRKLYDQITTRSKSLTSSDKVKKVSLSNTMMELRKVCNHPFLFIKDSSAFNFDDMIRSSGKFELLDRMLPKLKETGHKVLIFSQMTKVLDILQDYLDYKGYTHLRLDGTVKSDLRGQLVKDWNAKDSPHFVFLLSTRAGGLGLNLQSADTVIIFDSDFNPQQDIQAMARAHRIGQTRSVRVFVLVTASPIEEKIYEIAQEKRDAEVKVIKAGMFDQRSTFKERQEFLESLMSKDGNDGFDAETPDDDTFNQIIARGEKEYDLFTEMDINREKEEKEYYKKLKKKVPSRLMTEEDLPDWLKNIEVDLETPPELGTGKRTKKQTEFLRTDMEDIDLEGLEDDSEEEPDDED